MLRPLNVATPAEAVRTFVPASVPPPGLASNATVTLVVAVPTRLPNASKTSICMAGAIAAPAVVVDGSTKNDSRLAGPAATLKSTEIAEGSAGVAVASSE